MKNFFKEYKATTIFLSAVIGVIVLIFGVPFAINIIRESNIKYAQPVGELKIESRPDQELAVVIYAEKQAETVIPDTRAHCSATSYGYDSKYIYASVICGVYKSNGELGPQGIGTEYGRYTYEGSYYDPIVTKVENQGEDNVNPSLESIYPAQMFHLAMPNVIQ